MTKRIKPADIGRTHVAKKRLAEGTNGLACVWMGFPFTCFCRFLLCSRAYVPYISHASRCLLTHRTAPHPGALICPFYSPKHQGWAGWLPPTCNLIVRIFMRFDQLQTNLRFIVSRVGGFLLLLPSSTCVAPTDWLTLMPTTRCERFISLFLYFIYFFSAARTRWTPRSSSPG